AQARRTRDGRLTLMHGKSSMGSRGIGCSAPKTSRWENTTLKRRRFLVLGLLVLLAALFVGAGVLWFARNRTGSYRIIMRGGRSFFGNVGVSGGNLFLVSGKPAVLFGTVTKPTYSCQFGLASVVHPVEQVANRLHHGVWSVDVECGVRSVFQRAVFTVAHGIGNGLVDGQLDVVQLALRGFGREHRPKWIDAHAGEHDQRDIGHVAAAAALVADALEVLGLFQPDAPRFEVVF